MDSYGYINKEQQEYIPFCGTFNGDDYTISNLNITKEYAGLFTYTQHAHMNNLYIKDMNINGKEAAGGLIAHADDYTTIWDCSCNGNISSHSCAGGLIGIAQHIIIEKCSTNCNVLVEYDLAGGLVGILYNTKVTDCQAKGSILSGKMGLGGLIGEAGCSGTIMKLQLFSCNFITRWQMLWDRWVLGSASQYTVIQNYYSIGNVTIKEIPNRDIGGFVGYLSRSLVSNCYATGIVTTQGESCKDVGGLVGDCLDSEYIFNSYFNSKNLDNSFGISKSITEMKTTEFADTLNTKLPNKYKDLLGNHIPYRDILRKFKQDSSTNDNFPYLSDEYFKESHLNFGSIYMLVLCLVFILFALKLALDNKNKKV